MLTQSELDTNNAIQNMNQKMLSKRQYIALELLKSMIISTESFNKRKDLIEYACIMADDFLSYTKQN